MRYLTALLFVLATLAVSAAEQLSLRQAAETISAHNHTIKAAEEQVVTAQRNRQAARGLYMPKVSATAAWVTLQKDLAIDINPLKPLLGNLDIAPLLGLDWSYTLQRRNLGFIEADITIPLFMGGKIIAANRAAEAEYSAATAESKACNLAVFTTLVERYFGVVLAHNTVEVRQLAVTAIERHKADIVALIDNGMATNTALLQIEYALIKSQQELRSAQSLLTTAHRALQTTIGSSGTVQPTTSIFICNAIESLSSFLEQAEQGSAQLEIIDAKSRLARENIAIHRASFFPEFVAMAGGGFGHNITNILPRWAVGVGMRFTLFDGLNREYSYAAAKSTAKRVEELKLAANQDIKLLVESLYNKSIDHLNKSLALGAAIDAARSYLDSIREAFRQGMATSTEVIDATLALAATQIEQLEAAYNFDISLAKLLESCGQSDRFFDYIDSINSTKIEYENH